MSNAIPDTCEICYGCGEVELLDRRTVSCPECVGRELAERIAAAEAERDALALEVTHWKQEAESYKPAWDQMKAELATARQTIERLSAPLSIEEVCEHGSSDAWDEVSVYEAVIRARKDAKPICGGCGKCLDCLRIERSNAKP
jgi:hypothetical protein